VLEFTVAYGRGSRVPGVEIHRVTTMPAAFSKGVVAVTSPMRARLDAASVAPDLVPDAMVRAFTAKLFTPRALEAEIGRASTHGKPGVVALRAALNDLGVGRYTPSQQERRARRLFRACGLPPPQVEVKFGEHGEYRLRLLLARGRSGDRGRRLEHPRRTRCASARLPQAEPLSWRRTRL
jgi:hypothetical protein